MWFDREKDRQAACQSDTTVFGGLGMGMVGKKGPKILAEGVQKSSESSNESRQEKRPDPGASHINWRLLWMHKKKRPSRQMQDFGALDWRRRVPKGGKHPESGGFIFLRKSLLGKILKEKLSQPIVRKIYLILFCSFAQLSPLKFRWDFPTGGGGKCLGKDAGKWKLRQLFMQNNTFKFTRRLGNFCMKLNKLSMGFFFGVFFACGTFSLGGGFLSTNMVEFFSTATVFSFQWHEGKVWGGCWF